MLITLLVGAFVEVLTILLTIIPKVTVIPFVDSYLVTGFGYWNAILIELPFLQVLWQCTLWYFGFKALIMLLKFFVGHRINI